MTRWTVIVCAILMAPPTWSCELSVAPNRVVYGDEPAVFVGSASTPVAGTLTTDGFVPAFAFTPGLTYRVEAKGCPHADFAIPQRAATPIVESIFPTSDELPENILRFYVRFSEPMRDGAFLSNVRLTDELSGTDLTGVFFDNMHELWSPDRRQVTLIVDPGRVKTGLSAHNRFGRAFVAGRRYTLAVLPGWRSMAGGVLNDAYAKTFSVSKEDRSRIDPANWQLTTPVENSYRALTVGFGEPVDHVSIQSYLAVHRASGEKVSGGWSATDSGRKAIFEPAQHWDGAQYELRINARFEDIAANNLNGAFEHEIGALRHDQEGWESVVPFVVSSPSQDGDPL